MRILKPALTATIEPPKEGRGDVAARNARSTKQAAIISSGS